MRITDVEPIVLRLDQVDATRADGTQDAFLVRIHTDEGIDGVGEADTAPLLARTIVEMPSSHAVARGLREVLVGEDPLQVDRLWQRLFHASDHYGVAVSIARESATRSPGEAQRTGAGQSEAAAA